MKINETKRYKENPVGAETEDWFKLPKYPSDVHVCPLCGLPETTGIYKLECDCWDD